MTDIYYTSEFKKSYETYYDFNIPLDVNLDVRGNDKIKFKLVDFTIMNSMLNITSYHQNNYFKIIFDGYEYDLFIDDGSYTATSFRDFINDLFIQEELPIAMNYDKKTNKFYFMVNDNLEFYPMKCSKLFGFNLDMYSFTVGEELTAIFYGETFANMLPYTKIILTTNLVFNNNSQNNFESKYSSNSGMGDIICWLSRDAPLFTILNYHNNQNLEIELANKNIKNIGISIMNEFKEFIIDAPVCHLHFQLITYDDTNWFKKFFKLISDIYYSLLSIYFKK